MRLTSLLPWRSAVRLHMGIGRVCWRLMTRHRIIVERNIELCFPKLDADGVRRLVRQHFENLGACLAETSFAWFGRVDQSRIPFVIEGDEHVFAALAKGRGVILYTGHFTPLEICAPVLNDTLPNFAFMFHPRRNELLDEFQRRGRRRSSEISFPRDDVRAMLRALARNAVVWYAPDQYFSSRGSTVLPFLGEPQTVSTATCRLARASGAAVVPFFYRRLADGSGYVLRFEPEVENAGTDDVEAGTRRLLAVLENFIRECPEQYAWTHRRLKHRPTEPAAPEEDSRDTGGSAAPEADAPRRRSIWTTLLAILGVSSFIAVADNGAFFNSVAAATRGDEHQAAIVLSMFLLIGTTLVTFLALAIGRRTFKVVAALLLITAAAAGYFMSNFGVLFDPSMIRNIAETDVREAAPLVTPAFFLHVAAFGLAPAAAVFLLPLGGIGWRRELTVRGSSVLCLSLLLGGTLYANYGPVSFFAQQNHVLRMQMNPVYPLYSLYQYVTRADDKPPAVREPLAATRVVADAQAKPTLFVFVMGETARADRFSLNGYERDTNRFTRPLNVVNFPHVSSCGTSTADSVPCIFSRYGRDGFSHARFASNEPVFQTLKRLGVKTAWLDNSTGCKDICTPATFESLAGAADPALCRDDVCIDEILLTDFAGRIEDDSQDHFIVLHQRGSHGPAYYTDTPRQLKEWLPECDVPSVQNCDLASINNAYDNTILYTDYVLARTISLLQEQSDRFATAMLYVSDHGESLGEKGLYLHGMPYALAPPEQTGVPMIFWASPDFYSSRAINPECLRVAAQEPTSHDAIFHSILSLFDVEAQAYDRGLDLFAGCKSGSMSTS
ncbi:MAG: phosphoethanolamine--lipid A transferase, partial [Gammaproteobacteria bacterium]